MRCVYDPLSGRESQFDYSPKRVHRFAVIGGGPAGLEFARLASSLGSKVTLFERAAQLGGRLREWAQLPNRNRIAHAIRFWEECMLHPNVTLHLGTVAPPPDALLNNVDFVVLACGGQQKVPEHDFAGTNVISRTVDEVFSPDIEWGQRKVVVMEADRFGDPLGIALYLRERGAHVTVVCPFSEIGLGLDPVTRASRITSLHRAKIQAFEWSDARPLGNQSVLVWNHAENTDFQIDGVTDMIWCVNPLPAEQVSAIRSDRRIVPIGDALLARGLEDATKQGHDLAYELICGILEGNNR